METAIAILLVGASLAAAYLAFADAVRRPARASSLNGAGPTTSFAGESPAAIALLAHDGSVEATAAAREALGLVGAPRDLGELTAPIAVGADRLRSALRRLTERGDAFREVVELRDGRLLEAAGAPQGFAAAVVFSDQTAVLREAARARAAAEAAKEELRDLRAAHRAAGVYSWRTDASGAIRWRSDGFADLPPPTRRGLVESAAPPERGGRNPRAADAKRGARRVSVDGPGGDRFFEIDALDRDASGDALTVATDIGAVIRSEMAMERLIETMSETFAHLKVGLMIFDADARLTLFNPAILEIFGGAGDWLIKRPHLKELLDRLRQTRNLPERLDYAAWRDSVADIAGTTAQRPMEEIWHLSDGRSLATLFRQHGSGGLAFVVEDVTESMALRRINSSERAVNRAATDMLEEGVAVFGPDGRLSMANEALKRIWGLGPDGAPQKRHVTEMVADWRRATGPHPFWAALLGSATQGRERLEVAHKIELEDGRSLSARLSPMPDGSTLAVFGDATASERVAAVLKERNEALEHADEMRSALIDQISHQMRTPLNSALGLGQLLSDPRFGDLNETQGEYVQGIIDSCNDLLDAINGMSDLISVGVKLEDEPDAPLDLGAELDEVVMLFGRRLKDRAPKVEVECAVSTIEFDGRSDWLRQIASHMLMDAAAKSPPGAPLRLSVAQEGEKMVLACGHAVADDADDSGITLSLVRRFTIMAGGETEVIGRAADETADADEPRATPMRAIICRIPLRNAGAAPEGGEVLDEDQGERGDDDHGEDRDPRPTVGGVRGAG